MIQRLHQEFGIKIGKDDDLESLYSNYTKLDNHSERKNPNEDF
ncbi:hypothetical protein Gotur_004714 [Gossypium turneri]